MCVCEESASGGLEAGMGGRAVEYQIVVNSLFIAHDECKIRRGVLYSCFGPNEILTW